MGNRKRVRVLVVDDSAYNRRTITKILERSPFIEVVGTGRDGEEALRRAIELQPDIITLDLEMPKLDGFSFLRVLMSRQPTPVLVVSGRNEGENVFKALELGAVDFVAKPTRGISSELENIGEELLSKVLSIKQLRLENAQHQFDFTANRPEGRRVAPKEAVAAAAGEPPWEPGAFKLFAIGSSTGGPGAITSVLSSLPKNLPAALLVAQHMPRGFTRPFAERLDRFTALDVREACDGEIITPGRVFVAPGGTNLTVRRRGTEVLTVLTEKNNVDRYVPSVNALLQSAAVTYGPECVAVILTGMGDDGMDGVRAVKKHNGYAIAESAETSVIFGMPRKVISTGVVDRVLPLWEISDAIVGFFRSRMGEPAAEPGEKK
ncbi:MAG: chemotaxis response regulator protein-glutamate methylesterase [Myxococcota bacterium]